MQSEATSQDLPPQRSHATNHATENDMNKRGVIMVKGLLALVGLIFKVFKSFSGVFSSNLVKHGI